jgi:glycerol kinase
MSAKTGQFDMLSAPRQKAISYQVLPSDAVFGLTDFEETLSQPVPICAVMGDSNCALFGQGCHKKGQVKATYGTGSSIMMNIGNEVLESKHGLVTSVAWSLGGQVDYVLEGNVNHSGSVITWMKDQAHWIDGPEETEKLAREANPADKTVLIPAFSGVGAPYWHSNAHALIAGMCLSTGKPELVKAGLESIAYQITDILRAMQVDSGLIMQELRVDGGATENKYLMQFQSDLANVPVRIAFAEQLSGIGACYAAGIAGGVWKRETLFTEYTGKEFLPAANDAWRAAKLQAWEKAVQASAFIS